MEHRPLAIRRYLNEADSSPYERILAAKEPDREQYYVDTHKPQLRTVRQDISRRDTSQVERFPFLCVFHFAGCDQKFENKRDWKDHVVSQHFTLSRVFWECDERNCTHPERPLERCTCASSLQTKIPPDNPGLRWKDYSTRYFANKHEFRTHLIHHHRPTAPHDSNKDISWVLDREVQWILDRQDSGMRMVCGLPEDLGCPMPQCASMRFTGPTAWDQRLNHAAEHFLSNPQCLAVFGGEKDAELVQWASSDNVAISQQASDNCLRQSHACDKSVADSGYGSMPGALRHPNPLRQGGSSPIPRKMPEWTSNIIARWNGLEEPYLDEMSDTSGVRGWALEHLIDEDIGSSTYVSFQEQVSQYESAEDDGTLDTSQASSDAGSPGESDDMPEGNADTAAVMEWFHGWLRGWLAPLTRERPSGSNNSQSTTSASASQSQTSSTQKKKGTSQPRRTPKRRRRNDDEDGNEKNPKSQRANKASETPRLACPYFKRNPRKYGQPAWKSCVHPGYDNVHRLK
ncbi:hypothetical protein IL306_013392 [Fusarium sp. DS 682]|nr:hypothetical protein IL306_013392 [Fusarium sp. DS 682]